MELYINFLYSCVEVQNILDVSALTDLDKIELDARDLEIVSVSWEQGPPDLTGSHAFKYLRDINKLVVIPDRIIRSGEEFKLKPLRGVFLRQYSGRNL